MIFLVLLKRYEQIVMNFVKKSVKEKWLVFGGDLESLVDHYPELFYNRGQTVK